MVCLIGDYLFRFMYGLILSIFLSYIDIGLLYMNIYFVTLQKKMDNKFNNALYGLTTLIECGTTQFKSQGSGFYYNVMTPKDPNIEGGQWRAIEGISWIL